MTKSIQTTVLTTTEIIREQITTQSIEIAPGISACRTTVVRDSNGQIDKKVSESIRHTLTLESDHPGEFVIVRPELIRIIRTNGWISSDDHLKMISKKPFTRAKRSEPYHVVRLKSYDHTAFDVSGEPLPVGVHFCYIDGRVSDRNFDLDQLVKHLSSRPDIRFRTERFSGRLIQSVPYYNRGDDSGYQFIEFIWGPEIQLYREFREKSKLVDHFARHQVALTLMGADQFRLEKPPNSNSDLVPDDLEDY